MPEVAYTLRKARALFYSHPTYHTLLRWVHSGVNAIDGHRVRLRAYKEGGIYVVTRSAVEQFLKETNGR